MKSKPRLVSKQSGSVTALKQKLTAAKTHAEELKAAAQDAKAGFKRARKAHRQARKAAKQARRAAKAIAVEIRARAAKKIRRPRKARLVGAKKPAKQILAKLAAVTVEPKPEVSLGLADGPVEAAGIVAPVKSRPAAT